MTYSIANFGYLDYSLTIFLSKVLLMMETKLAFSLLSHLTIVKKFDAMEWAFTNMSTYECCIPGEKSQRIK
jgi:hypothetical protein